MRSKCITTWPMPSGPVRKPEMLRPGLNGSVVVSRAVEYFEPVAGRIVEHDQVLHTTLVGERARAARDRRCRRPRFLRRQRIERGRVRYLPAEEADALPAVGIDHQPLLAVIHAEGERRAALVDALQAEKIAAVARPIAQVLGANADIAQSFDAHANPRSCSVVAAKLSAAPDAVEPCGERLRGSVSIALHARACLAMAPLSRG